MDKKEFNSLWENIAKVEIEKMIASSNHVIKIREGGNGFRDNTFNRYQTERDNFIRTAKIIYYNTLDRHKVAALFYVAFVDKFGGYPFMISSSLNERLQEADSAITHEIAFNIALGILVSFIISDKGIDASYRKYIEENGIAEPELICLDENKKGKNSTNYKEETIKQLIYAQEEKKLSIPLIANIFFSLENDTRHCYKRALSLP
jgi:hypothetical protein